MAVTLPPREFTDAEIDGMTQAELKAALKNVGSTVGGKVPTLKARLKAFMTRNRAGMGPSSWYFSTQQNKRRGEAGTQQNKRRECVPQAGTSVRSRVIRRGNECPE
jgi:hypothetical protein